jgi:hypothetical protein
MPELVQLINAVRNARAADRKRVKIGEYTVYIYGNYALFDHPEFHKTDEKVKTETPKRRR